MQARCGPGARSLWAGCRPGCGPGAGRVQNGRRLGVGRVHAQCRLGAGRVRAGCVLSAGWVRARCGPGRAGCVPGAGQRAGQEGKTGLLALSLGPWPLAWHARACLYVHAHVFAHVRERICTGCACVHVCGCARVNTVSPPGENRWLCPALPLLSVLPSVRPPWASWLGLRRTEGAPGLGGHELVVRRKWAPRSRARPSAGLMGGPPGLGTPRHSWVLCPYAGDRHATLPSF